MDGWIFVFELLRIVAELQLQCGDLQRRVARLESRWANAEQSFDDLRLMAVTLQ